MVNEAYLVIIDTNIIFHQDKKHVVDPDFEELWEEQASLYDLSLYIPEVVEGEIIFQQTGSALKFFERANNQFDSLRGVTDQAYPHRVTKSRVIDDVKARFDKWKRNKKAQVIKTPFDKICWESIVEGAVLRKPPFSNDTAKGESEKGFRDAVILETVVDFTSESDQQVVFLCNDSLLRKESELRLLHSFKFSAYSSLKEFESYLRLKNEEIEKQRVNALTDKAMKKFFTFNDFNSLAYKEKINKKIPELFEKNLSSPEDLLSSRLPYHDSEVLEIDSAETSHRSFKVKGKPEFIKIVSPNTFYWNSTIHYECSYRFFIDEKEDSVEYKYRVIFNVNWKVNISINNIFTKMKVVDIKLDGRDLIEID